jgi:hypothetical protein
MTARARESTKNVVLHKRKSSIFVEMGWTLYQVDRQLAAICYWVTIAKGRWAKVFQKLALEEVSGPRA